MTILPTVMPDEFVLGYWGRIHILNLFRTPNQTAEALIEYFDLPSSRIQRIEALALSAQLSTQKFVQNHTLIPAHGAIAIEHPGVDHGAPKLEALIKQWWKLLHRPGAFFCPACASEQRSHWGVSYWQRACQLRGICWCPTHLCPLVACSETAFTVTTPRVELVTNAIPAVKAGTTSWSVIERYSQIMTGFLERNRRAGMRNVVRQIRPVAVQQSIYAGTNKDGQFLSDIAVKQLPAWWLDELFPHIRTKQLGAPFSSLDNTVLNGHAQPHAYALAMALLYESSDDALAAVPNSLPLIDQMH